MMTISARSWRSSSGKLGGGFTLVELMVVLSIMGMLLSLALNGVQSARESARRIQCSNRIRQQALALHSFHTSFNALPFGNDRRTHSDYSWCTAVLAQLEETAIAERWDRRVVWYDATSNLELAKSIISTFRCPSSIFDSSGDTDYAGVRGSLLGGGPGPASLDVNNGVLITSNPKRSNPVSLPEVTDGTSYTIFIAEVVDRLPEEHGLWADGLNVISHDNGSINIENSGEIFSHHPGGAQVALSDGAIRFLTESIDVNVIGGLCTRDSHEDLNSFFSH